MENLEVAHGRLGNEIGISIGGIGEILNSFDVVMASWSSNRSSLVDKKCRRLSEKASKEDQIYDWDGEKEKDF